MSLKSKAVSVQPSGMQVSGANVQEGGGGDGGGEGGGGDGGGEGGGGEGGGEGGSGGKGPAQGCLGFTAPAKRKWRPVVISPVSE
jgi:hypothetical protein